MSSFHFYKREGAGTPIGMSVTYRSKENKSAFLLPLGEKDEGRATFLPSPKGLEHSQVLGDSPEATVSAFCSTGS